MQTSSTKETRAEPDARRLRAAGDEHSSHSDEELLSSLPNAFFKPVKCSEEEDSGDRDPEQRTRRGLPERPLRKPAQPTDVPSPRRATQDPSALTPSPFFATPKFQKPKLLMNSLGHKTTAPTKAQLRAAAARERWEHAAEQRALQQQTNRESFLW